MSKVIESLFPDLAATGYRVTSPSATLYNCIACCAEIDADYARLQSISVQREFAEQTLKTRCSAALFALRSRKCQSAREFLGNKATLPYVLKLLGVKEEVEVEAEET